MSYRSEAVNGELLLVSYRSERVNGEFIEVMMLVVSSRREQDTGKLYK